MNETPPQVIFSRPDDWDEWTHEQKAEYASRIADAMGFTDEESDDLGTAVINVCQGMDRVPPTIPGADDLEEDDE